LGLEGLASEAAWALEEALLSLRAD